MVIGILRLIIAIVALTLMILRIKAKDRNTAIYWAIVCLYWSLNFAEYIAKL